MATLSQKIEAEKRMRELLAQEDLPEPDDVEYGEGCIRLLWHEQKAQVIVDIDDPDDAPMELVTPELD